MTSEIISSKEKIVMGRNRFTNAIYLATLAIMLIAVVLSWQRTDTFEQERASAAADDREVWMATEKPHISIIGPVVFILFFGLILLGSSRSRLVSEEGV